MADGLDVLQGMLGDPSLPGTLHGELHTVFVAPPASKALRIERLPWRDVPFSLYPAILNHRQAV